MFLSGINLCNTGIVNTQNLQSVQGVQMSQTWLYTHVKENLECVSSGVICFSVEPITKRIYILLGQESCFHNFRLQRGVWCDFGGKTQKNETPEETASREFAEETLGCVQVCSDKINDYNMTEAMLTCLLKRQYSFRLNFVDNIWDKKREVNQQVLRVFFGKQIPWQPEVPDLFAKVREDLVVIWEKNISHENTPVTFCHPSLSSILTNKTQVNNDFLEKFQLQWWSLNRIQDAIRNKGKFKNQRLRKNFIHVLRVVLAIFLKKNDIY